MGLSFRRHDDGTTTGTNMETGFTFTSADRDEVERVLRENAGWTYTPPPPPLPLGHHRFALEHDAFGMSVRDADGLEDRYARLRARPPHGCVPEGWGDSFALLCERPGDTLLAAVTDTVEEIRRENGLVMTGLGIEKPDEWMGRDRDGHCGKILAQLILQAAHRARACGYPADDLVHLLRTALRPE
ncbi:hypothetical protein [Streptomyces sp. NBC_01465]|uniref:hypothetical protein n=1 Tax=Streptomyces sp. NBC_01465 TaxID=2903878 RepID=UPI002E374855|nr:hypothetical protein [Streptomyces sp. NBC_01465]